MNGKEVTNILEICFHISWFFPFKYFSYMFGIHEWMVHIRAEKIYRVHRRSRRRKYFAYNFRNIIHFNSIIRKECQEIAKFFFHKISSFIYWKWKKEYVVEIEVCGREVFYHPPSANMGNLQWKQVSFLNAFHSHISL